MGIYAHDPPLAFGWCGHSGRVKQFPGHPAWVFASPTVGVPLLHDEFKSQGTVPLRPLSLRVYTHRSEETDTVPSK